MKWIKFARLVDCPTCGAPPSRQKWKPRKPVDVDEMVAISDVVDRLNKFNPGSEFRLAE